MNKLTVLAVLMFYGCIACANQTSADADIKRQWTENLFDESNLKQQYYGYCIDSDFEINTDVEKQLCNLTAEELFKSTLHRSLTFDQIIEIYSCRSEQSDEDEDCTDKSFTKSRNLRDALVASLCKMDPTLVGFDRYYENIVRRGNGIYDHTRLIFDCDKVQFVDGALGHFTLHQTRINYAEYPVLHEHLVYVIEQARQDEFSKQIDSLTTAQLNAVGRRLLFDAIDADNSFYLETLLSSGVSPNNANDYFNQPLGKALSTGNNEAVAILLEHGANPTVFDDSGNSGLYLAVENCSLKTIDTLLKHGVDVNGQLKDFGTISASPLAKAAEFGRKDVVMRLLKDDAIIHSEQVEYDYNTLSPIVAAIRGGNEDIFNLLLERGATLPDDRDLFLIKFAIEGGNANILNTLFFKGIEIPTEKHGDILFTLSGSTRGHSHLEQYPYWQEREYQRPDQLDKLVAHGLKIEYKENGAHSYITRLTSKYRYPAEADNPVIRKTAIERLALTVRAIQHYADAGLDLNYLDSDETLLMDAASGEYLELVKLLLKLGADKTTATASGRTATDIAGYNLSEKLAKYPDQKKRIEDLKQLYFLLDGKLDDLPEISKREPLSVESLLRSILQR